MQVYLREQDCESVFLCLFTQVLTFIFVHCVCVHVCALVDVVFIDAVDKFPLSVCVCTCACVCICILRL